MAINLKGKKISSENKVQNAKQPVAHLQLVVLFKPETFNFQPLEPACSLAPAS